jgi:membrane protein DedA with SNARE-associated domain
MESAEKLKGVLLTLFVFGIVYNWVVGWLERKGYDRGYTALLVVLGVGVTVALSGFLIGMQATLLVTACFVASGLPMIVGSIVRYVDTRSGGERVVDRVLQKRLEGELGACRHEDRLEDTYSTEKSPERDGAPSASRSS